MIRNMADISVSRVNLLELDRDESAEIGYLLRSAKAAGIFHTLEWNRLLVKYFNLRHIALIARFEETVVGLYVLFHYGNSTYHSPAIQFQSVYGGPIALNDDPVIIEALIRAADRFAPLAYFQVWTAPCIDITPFKQNHYFAEPMFTPVMDLRYSEEDMWARLHRDKRNKIRKAQKAGLTLRAGTLDDLQEYHAMMSDTLTRGAVKPLPLDFLQQVLEQLAPLGAARFFIVEQLHKVISGSIILYFDDTVFGWDIGWRREYAALSPNDFLVWEVAVQAQRDGFSWFDLLRIEFERLPGIARWKERFGCDILPCYLLRKETPAYRFVKPMRIAFTQPQRVLEKLRELVRP
jgi:hypothetical protein